MSGLWAVCTLIACPTVLHHLIWHCCFEISEYSAAVGFVIQMVVQRGVVWYSLWVYWFVILFSVLSCRSYVCCLVLRKNYFCMRVSCLVFSAIVFIHVSSVFFGFACNKQLNCLLRYLYPARKFPRLRSHDTSQSSATFAWHSTNPTRARRSVNPSWLLYLSMRTLLENGLRPASLGTSTKWENKIEASQVHDRASLDKQEGILVGPITAMSINVNCPTYPSCTTSGTLEVRMGRGLVLQFLFYRNGIVPDTTAFLATKIAAPIILSQIYKVNGISRLGSISSAATIRPTPDLEESDREEDG